MKKRQLGCMLAAISLLTPNIIFGQEVIKGKESIDNFVKEMGDLLKVKYTDKNEFGGENSTTNNVYKIKADGEIIEDTFDLKLKIEKYILEEEVLNIEIIDKGHRKDNGEVLGKEYSYYDRYETNEELYKIYTNYKNEKPIKNIELLDSNNLQTNEVDKIEKVTITLLNNNKIELKKGDEKLDFSKYIDRHGNRVDLTNIDINTSEGMSIAKAIIGFEKARKLDYLKEFDIPSKVVREVQIIEDGIVEDVDLAKLYNGAYSKYGKDLITTLADRKFYKNGNKYLINYNLLNEGTDEEKVINNISNIVYKDGRYSFDLKMNITKDKSTYINNKSLQGNQNFKLSIYSNNQVRLSELRNDVIDAIANGNKDVGDSKYKILAGDDRFETSIEVSNEYTNINGANSIVLVGEDAIIDGLSASPFAKYKNAPILLTKKDEVPINIMNEIKRIFNNYKNVDTVYLIGGENTISSDVYKQLVEELKNVKIVRIDGKDRYETSINICNSMNLESVNKAYVVGGNGIADAMSIAPMAVREIAPIVVSSKNSITKDIEHFMVYNENITNVNVIGGISNIDTDVLLDIKNLGMDRDTNKNIDISRISGDDRFETNAKVLELFNIGNEKKITVAKDGINNEMHLVDSMVGASLGYPIVLSTDKLSTLQGNIIGKLISSQGHSLIQVGSGINENILKELMNK